MRSLLGTSSIDIHAAQCKNCTKWRVIDTQEAFEEIRCKAFEEPFHCSLKANCSCDDPTDIEYDSSRTWVIDKLTSQRLLKVLGEAWYLEKITLNWTLTTSLLQIMQDTIPENVEQKDSVSANKKAKIAKDDI
ncbi:Zinc finger, CW-type [Sesbania bispinosa]|nr:Zinc finger, CW-type [Sesbania bispinosa]